MAEGYPSCGFCFHRGRLMKKVILVFLLFILVLGLMTPSFSAKGKTTAKKKIATKKQKKAIKKKKILKPKAKAKKKAAKIKKAVEKKEIKTNVVVEDTNIPSLEEDVVELAEEATIEEVTVEAATIEAVAISPLTLVAPAVPPPAPQLIQPVTPMAKPVEVARIKSFLAEAGLGGGAFLISINYQKNVSDKITYLGGLGYGIGNQYGVLVFDLARVAFDMKGFYLGGGMCYAMYSERVADVFGISGTLPSKNIIGFEVLGGRRFGDIIGKISYNTALGVRMSAGCEL